MRTMITKIFEAADVNPSAHAVTGAEDPAGGLTSAATGGEAQEKRGRKRPR